MSHYRLFGPDDCPAGVFRLRYAIYVEEMHRKQFYACHESQTIRDPLDDFAHHVVAFDAERTIIGCVRLNMARDGDLGRYLDLYGISALSPHEQATASICTRNMVLAKYRRTGVSVRMLKMIYDYGIRAGMTTCFMDVNPPLEALFERFGYKFVAKRVHPEYGDVSVYRLDVLDLNYLKSVRSPFAELCAAYLAEKAESAPA